MYYRARSEEEIPMENTAIWSCTQGDCKGWMRDNFAFEYEPTCRLCHSPMESSMRMLPLLENSNSNLRASKRGVQIDSQLM
ncbi:MAG: cold-shock protein [Tumebacillaceae bacterium]